MEKYILYDMRAVSGNMSEATVLSTGSLKECRDAGYEGIIYKYRVRENPIDGEAELVDEQFVETLTS